MSQATDVLIVGGGVIGCSLAYHLRQRGIEVTLLERTTIGSEASGAAAGLFAWLKPMGKFDAYHRLLRASSRLFPAFVAELELASGLSVEYTQTGTLRTIHHEVRIARLQSWLAACRAQELPVELLSAEEVREHVPLLAADTYGAVWFPTDGQVRASRFVAALARAARLNGAHLYEQQEVVGIQTQGERVSGVVTAQDETFACQRLILATGAWSACWNTWLRTSLPIVPQCGQLIALRQPDPAIRHMVIGKGIYIAPKQDGTVIVGATRDDVGFDCRVTPEGIASLQMRAQALIPSLAQAELVQSWAGLRPKTPDTHPILGALPGWSNVTLAVGHYSFGVLLSAITGQQLAAQLATQQSSVLLQPFALARFAGK
ncbi:MAG TPA: glycine oxidase ThiO [Ktedonobacteraceae bacterium]|jgi:glycine oxidase|nr:glycine oxidase ThiO [Ktedonobacteraceae bacterium]